MPWVNPNELPDFIEARKRVETNREEFFLGLERKICGFSVRVMTVRDFIILDRCKCPFLYRRIPTAMELVSFLRLLSPQFDKWLSGGWRSTKIAVPLMLAQSYLFGRRCRKAFGLPPSEQWEKATGECFEYVNSIFEDSPSGGSGRAQFVSFTDLWLDLLRSQYGWLSKEHFLSMSLPDVFAAIRAIQMRQDPKLNFSSKAEGRLWSNMLQKLNQNECKLDDITAGRVKLN